jgi:HSP20 family protein
MYNEINELFNEMSKAFEGACKDIKNPILVDVIKNESSYDVLASLPGVNKEDVNLSCENGKLTISVNDKKEDENEGKDKFIINERISGFNNRTVYLKDIDETNISAKLSNGVLMINVPFAKKKVSNIVIE